MPVHDGALMHFKDKTPMKIEDLKGLKIRAANRINSQLIAPLGATPVQMPLPAVPWTPHPACRAGPTPSLRLP